VGDIELEKVSKRFGRVEVVRALDLHVASREFVTVLGPSGCGKTTTLNMIAGLEDVSGGTITIDGKRVEDLPPHRRDLAFVFQDYALYPHMTVFGNMAFGLRMRHTPKAEIDRRVHEAALRLEIDELLDRRPRELSGGQRQRVALGRSIVRRPSVFLYDEPLSNLDALMRDQMRSELKRLHIELGATSVYVTHDQEEAMTLSDRVAVLRNGRLEQYGTPTEIYAHPASEFVATFVGKPRINLYDVQVGPQGLAIVEGTVWTIPVRAQQTGRMRLGLRPEELIFSSEESVSSVEGTVRLVEPGSGVTDVTVGVGPVDVRVRMPGFASLAIGARGWLESSRAYPHLFPPSGEQQLRGASAAKLEPTSVRSRIKGVLSKNSVSDGAAP
jgi:ABC-type sugar transport system ATPase subunit